MQGSCRKWPQSGQDPITRDRVRSASDDLTSKLLHQPPHEYEQQPQNVQHTPHLRPRIHNLYTTRLITSLFLTVTKLFVPALAPRCEPACARPRRDDIESDARVKDNAKAAVEIAPKFRYLFQRDTNEERAPFTATLGRKSWRERERVQQASYQGQSIDESQRR